MFSQDFNATSTYVKVYLFNNLMLISLIFKKLEFSTQSLVLTKVNNRNYLIPLWYNRFAVNFEESFHCAFWVLGMARRTSKHYSMYNLLVISSNPTIFPLEKYQFCDVLKTFSINILQRKWFYMLLCRRNLKYFNTYKFINCMSREF